MKERNIAVAIILSFVTCGIYLIIWMWALNDELRLNNNKPKNSMKSFLLSFITCGIYYLIWSYNMGKEVAEAGGDKNASLIYLILTLVGLPIVAVALAQNEVNKLCQKGNIL